MVDCLMEVTATFFAAGESTSYESLEDCTTLASYGAFSAGEGDYWGEPSETSELLIILRDFIGFSFSTIYSGDYTDDRGSGIHFEEKEGTFLEMLEGWEDTFSDYAKEEKAKYVGRRGRGFKLVYDTAKRVASPLLVWDSLGYSEKEEQRGTDRVKFIVALSYSCSGYDDDYGSEIDVLGKVDMSKLHLILDKVHPLLDVNSRVNSFKLK